MTSSNLERIRRWPRSRPEPGAWALGVAAANLALGICFSIFLFALPSDPERAFWGRYSQERVQLIVGILAATVVWALVSLSLALKRGWRTSIGERLFGKDRWADRVLPVGFLLLLSLFVGLVMYFPARLELTRYHYLRLAPYLIWPWAFLASVAIASKAASGLRPRVTTRAAERIALVGLFLVTLVPRVSLSGYSLPYQSMWDEVTTYPRALELISGKRLLEGDAVPTYGRASYGDPLIYLTAAGQVAGLLAKMRTGRVYDVDEYASPAKGVATILEAVHDSGAPLQFPRLLLALINSLTPILIYTTLRRHFGAGAWVSLAGGLVYALFSSDVITFSSFIWPDALATTLVAAAVLCALQASRAPRSGWTLELACAALVGTSIGVSIRYLGLISLPVLALALSTNRARWLERMGLLAAGLILGLLVTSPTLWSDFPTYLARMTGLAWVGDDSLPNRVYSLSYYLRHMFFGSGFGVVVLGAALIGYTRALRSHRRSTILLTLVAICHLAVITPTVYRQPRHALVLYPFVAIFAAMGLEGARRWIESALTWLRRRTQKGTLPPDGSHRLADPAAFLLFIVLGLPQIIMSTGGVAALRSFKSSQVRMAEYVRSNLERDTKIGLLDVIPFADLHLELSEADVHRVGLSVTMGELVQNGYEYVIGTEVVGAEFGDDEGTVWVTDFSSDSLKVVEFGEDALVNRGRPLGNIAIYLSRVPGSAADR